MSQVGVITGDTTGVKLSDQSYEHKNTGVDSACHCLGAVRQLHKWISLLHVIFTFYNLYVLVSALH